MFLIGGMIMFVGLRKGKKKIIKSGCFLSLGFFFYFTLLSFFLFSKNAG